MNEHVIVPQEDIEELEKARKLLHEMCISQDMPYETCMEITVSMWKMTHKRYPTVEG